jgi:transcriptional regulator with XRE-family HTH domain
LIGGVNLDKWIAEAVGKMHIFGISQSELAEKIGIRREHLNRILNGKENPKEASNKILSAIDEIIKLKSSA